MRFSLSVILLSTTVALSHVQADMFQQHSSHGLDTQSDPLAILKGMAMESDNMEGGQVKENKSRDRTGKIESPPQDSPEALLDAMFHSVQEELMTTPSFSDQVKKGLAELPSHLQEGFAKYEEQMAGVGSQISDWIHRSLHSSDPDAEMAKEKKKEKAKEDTLFVTPFSSEPDHSSSARKPHIVGRISVKQKVSKHIDKNGKEQVLESVPRMNTEFYEVDEAGHYHKIGGEELVGMPSVVPAAPAPSPVKSANKQEHKRHKMLHGHGHGHRHQHHHRHHDHDHGHSKQTRKSKKARPFVAASLSDNPHDHLRPVKLVNEPEFWIRLGLSVAIGCAFTMLIYSIVKLFVVVFIGIPMDRQEDDNEEDDEEAQKKKLKFASAAPILKI